MGLQDTEENRKYGNILGLCDAVLLSSPVSVVSVAD